MASDSEIQVLKDQIDRLARALNGLESKVNSLTSVDIAFQDSLNKLKQTTLDMSASVKGVVQNNQEIKAEVSSLSTTVTQFDSRERRIEDVVSGVSDRMAEFTSSIETQNRRNAYTRELVRRTSAGVVDIEDRLPLPTSLRRPSDIEAEILRGIEVALEPEDIERITSAADEMNNDFISVIDVNSGSVGEENVLAERELVLIAGDIVEELNGEFHARLLLRTKKGASALPENFSEEVLGRKVSVKVKRTFTLAEYIVERDTTLAQVLTQLPGAPNNLTALDILNAKLEYFTVDSTSLRSGSKIYFPKNIQERYWNGVVSNVARLGRGAEEESEVVALDVKTAFWSMQIGRHSRVFSSGSVRKVIEDVFAGILGETRIHSRHQSNTGHHTPHRFVVATSDSDSDSKQHAQVLLNIAKVTDPASTSTTPPELVQTRVQYNESDWDFVRRLMEQEGYVWYIRHTATTHQLVVVDSVAGLPSDSSVQLLEMRPVGHTKASEDRVTSWVASVERQPEAVAIRDKSFRAKPLGTLNSLFLEESEKSLESFVHGEHSAGEGTAILTLSDVVSGFGGSAETGLRVQGNSTSAHTAKRGTLADLAARRAEAFLAREEMMSIVTTSKSLWPGRKARFDAEEWRVVRIHHRFHKNKGFVAEADLYNHKESRVLFRPLPTVPIPRLDGVHNAVVVNSEGEKYEAKPNNVYESQIYSDSTEAEKQNGLGCVSVVFFWDENEEKTSFVRVNQVWAGNNFGFFFIPRTGMEVLVSFEQGDVNRPVVVGSVYSEENPPKYRSTGNYSGISSWPANAPRYASESDDVINYSVSYAPKAGGIAPNVKMDGFNKPAKELSGFNEVRFKDTEGDQELYIGAPKVLTQFAMEKQLDLISGERVTWIWGNFGPKALKEIWEDGGPGKGLGNVLDGPAAAASAGLNIPAQMARLSLIMDTFNNAPKEFFYINGHTARLYNGNVGDAVQGNVDWTVHGPKFEIKQTGYGLLMPMGSIHNWISALEGMLLKCLVGKVAGKVSVSSMAGKIAKSFAAKVVSTFLKFLIPGAGKMLNANFFVGYEVMVTQFLLEMPLIPASPILNGFLALIYAAFDLADIECMSADGLVSMEISTAGALEISAARELVLKAPVIKLETPNMVETITSGNLHYLPKMLSVLKGDKVAIEMNASGLPSLPHALKESLEDAGLPMPAIYSIEMIGLDIEMSGFKEVNIVGGLEGIEMTAWLSKIETRGMTKNEEHMEHSVEAVEKSTKAVQQSSDFVESNIKFVSESHEGVQHNSNHIEKKHEAIDQESAYVQAKRQAVQSNEDLMELQVMALSISEDATTREELAALAEFTHSLEQRGNAMTIIE